MEGVRISEAIAALSLSALGVILSFSCGPTLPSSKELGGTEQAMLEAQRAPRRASDATAAPDEPSRPASDGGREPDAGTGDAAQDASPESANVIDDAGDGAPDAPIADAASDVANDKCEDMEGELFDCDRIGGKCATMLRSMCMAGNEVLKTTVARHFGECLATAGSACHPRDVLACFQKAANHACVGASAADTCDDFLDRCGQPGELEDVLADDFCEKALFSLKDEIREALERCLEQGCEVKTCLRDHLPTGP